MGFNIAIDGPAGAGKSTIARRAAKRLAFIYVDTGAMYRTIALGLIRRGVALSDEEALKEALKQIKVAIGYEDGEQQMFLNGENVSGLIRTEEVSRMTSAASVLPCVRDTLTQLQRELAAQQDVLMDGRDIGTVILPDAQLKIYLTASVEMRALRRYRELSARGEACTLEEIKKDIAERDYRDMHRETAPLRQAEDAIRIDTSDLTIEEVVDRIVLLAHNAVCGLQGQEP